MEVFASLLHHYVRTYVYVHVCTYIYILYTSTSLSARAALRPLPTQNHLFAKLTLVQSHAFKNSSLLLLTHERKHEMNSPSLNSLHATNYIADLDIKSPIIGYVQTINRSDKLRYYILKRSQSIHTHTQIHMVKI